MTMAAGTMTVVRDDRWATLSDHSHSEHGFDEASCSRNMAEGDYFSESPRWGCCQRVLLQSQEEDTAVTICQACYAKQPTTFRAAVCKYVQCK